MAISALRERVMQPAKVAQRAIVRVLRLPPARRTAAAIDLTLHAGAGMSISAAHARSDGQGSRPRAEAEDRGRGSAAAGFGARAGGRGAATGRARETIALAAKRRRARGIVRRGRGDHATRSGATGIETPAGMRATPDSLPELRVGGKAGIVIHRYPRAAGRDRVRSPWSPWGTDPI